MRKLFFFATTIAIATQLTAQKAFRKNTLYGEIAGNGLVLSANYERQLGNKPGLGLHIGVGLGGYYPAIPVGVDYLFDLGHEKSFIEVGVGVTLAELELWDDKYYIGHNPYKAGFIPSIGYRHHTSYGLMWKLIYTPIFSSYRNIPLYAGASVGWRL
ncbi:MAG TPA: hypothetical protein VGQ09_12480 [Chitinophagaceae bacterium]|jgi:hypothetical protein|nr:hypothetical protein [Chitinophagaceae bacterium]